MCEGALVGMVGWEGPTCHPHQCRLAMASGGGGRGVVVVVACG